MVLRYFGHRYKKLNKTGHRHDGGVLDKQKKIYFLYLTTLAHFNQILYYQIL
jgi:hypothetical protein